MRIENLCKSYPGTVVFDNFNLVIDEGAVTCILGGSGAGKTTLLNIIAGLTEYEGRVDCVKCSYIFQEPRLVPNLTVEGNLRLVCRDGVKVAAALARVGLADRARSYPVALSGGQRQRAAIARAFVYESDFVLMDEPFSSLDLKLKLDMIQAFREVREGDGRSAVFVTHDIEEALCLADRIIVLRSGKAVFDSPNTPGLPFGSDNALRARLAETLLS